MAALSETKNEILSQEEHNESTKKLIVFTGFGVFEGHEEVNASWEAVKLLPEHLEHLGQEFVIKKIEVPVEYAAVDKAIEEIWKLEPTLVIHVGVHGSARCIHIEKLAYNHKFNRPDYAGKRLIKSTACLKNCDGVHNDVQFTRFCVDKICAVACSCEADEIDSTSISNEDFKSKTLDILNNRPEAMTISSKNVGNYLCGYIYLKSLDHDNKRTLFVHVPPVDRPFSPKEVCNALWKISKECVRQLKEDLNEF